MAAPLPARQFRSPRRTAIGELIVERYTPPLTTPTATKAPRNACTNVDSALTS